MPILDSLQRRLDSGYTHSMRDFSETAQDSMEGGTPEDMAAFAQAMQKVASSSVVANQEVQMKHNLTKSIIDGMQ